MVVSGFQPIPRNHDESSGPTVAWTGPDAEGPFVTQAQAMLSEMSSGSAEPTTGSGGDPDLGSVVMDTEHRIESVLYIPDGSPFARSEHQILTGDVALTS